MTKTYVKKPIAEVIGTIADVMKLDECEDGRSLFAFYIGGDDEVFILAASELQAWKSLRPRLGTIQKITQGMLSSRYKQEALRLMEEQNGETDSQE